MNTVREQEKYDELIKKLEEESTELTPMLQSKYYDEIIAEGDNIVPHLVSSVQDTKVKHYLTLMTIAEMDSNALKNISEETRIKIYLDSLQKGSPHNDWGLAGRYLSGASLDLVSIGKKAIPFVIHLLNDTADIGIWGSKEATINAHYQNRVCDFAYYLILNILGYQVTYPKTQAGRDKEIVKLKRSLQKMGLMDE